MQQWVLVDGRLAQYEEALDNITETDGGLIVQIPQPGPDPVDAPSINLLVADLAGELNGDEIALLRDLTQDRPRSAGEQDFLSCVKQPLSMREGYDLVVVILDRTTLDTTKSRVARLTLQHELDRLAASGTDRVLVLESGGFIPDQHVLLGDPASNDPPRRRVTTRGTPGPVVLTTHDTIRQGVHRIVRAWDDAPLCFFLGAGFSYSSTPRMPLGDEMRDYALQEMFRHVDDERPEQLAQRLFAQLQAADQLLPSDRADVPAHMDVREAFTSRLTLERVMWAHQQQFGGPLDATIEWFAERNRQALNRPGLGVMLMRELIQMAHDQNLPLLLFTVNIDELLEPAFEVIAPGGDLVSSNAAEIQANLEEVVDLALAGRTNDTGPRYIKLHGTISDVASLVIDLRAAGANPAMDEFSRQMRRLAAVQAPLVYVGHSMRDVDIAPALSSQGLADLREYWVLPEGPDRILERFISQRPWFPEDRTSRWMHHTTADDWMRHFMHLLHQHRGA